MVYMSCAFLPGWLLDSRMMFVSRVLVDGASIRSACLEFGISRPTGYKWLKRFQDGEGAGLLDASRRPHSSPSRTPDAVVERVLALKAEHPFWGGRKLALLEDGLPSARTIDRILKASGLACAASGARSVGSFERDSPNELWQMDFKGVPRGEPQVLGCVDDATRFCILLEPVCSQKLADWWPLLWEAFGEFGLPQAVLSDNGPAFRCNATPRFSSFDLKLLLLGVKPLHGRPRHPQTQGKIERFFGTLEREKGLGREREFRRTYNHVRPHEALQMDTPARRYKPSGRTRPKEMPSNLDFPEGSRTRKTSHKGDFSWNGKTHRLGRAAADTTIAVRDGCVYYGKALLGPLEQYEV